MAAAAASPPAADLAAVRRTDALIESLAARRPAGPAPAAAPASPAPPACAGDDPDPAVRLLNALIIDVDDQTADPAPPAPPAPSGPRRRGPRTIVALGVVGAVLASTGVAAAGGGAADRSTAAAPAPRASEQAVPAAAPAAGDADAATRARPQEPSAAPAPAPEPTRTGRPSRGQEREDIARLKRRLDDLFPPRRHHRRPEGPVRITRSAPSDRPEAAPGDDPVLDLDDLAALRREAERRNDRYRAPRWDD
ncbi:hypothetical protein HUT06_38680 [Actinomadura sp. NAK00032]|uniref:hypothetical protein n=1 Tax=Actinomadura sp. NAK00032 TaxID=2742128 RepID=UPI0015908B54|nr:hypothetical protein [Actinomadura sp. NAK00032]QKW39229.1 hypothetical protein HUT06_38680 [Actinomadura sp. NAK00032]